MVLDDSQRAHEIVGFLAGQYVKGWKAFLVAEQIHIAEKNQVAKISNELAKIIRTSCLETSVIALANVTDSSDSHDRSIHLNYLFNYATGMPSAFPLLPKGESLAKVVAGYKKLYEQFEPTLKKVHDQRDQLLAHIDRELLSNPYLHMDNPISDDELRDVFAFLHTVIYAFANYLSSKERIPTFDKNMSRKIKSDFSLMLS